MVAKKKQTKTRSVKKRTATKKVSVEAEPKKTFYVGVNEPLEKQRVLLQITADYLRMLQNIEKLKKTRVQKTQIMTEFERAMKVIRSDASKLYKLLPKYNLPHKVKPVEPKKPIEVKVQERVQKVQVKTEIDSLEAELAAIEGRLGSL